MNNRRAASNYLADMRADCTTAAGAATIAGLPEVGKVLAWIASATLDELRGMRYTEIIKQPAQRAEKQEGKTMRKLKVYLKTPYAFAVEIDGKEVYATGKAKDIANYCERHFGVKIPTETRNYSTGTKTHFDGMTKNGFEFDIE